MSEVWGTNLAHAEHPEEMHGQSNPGKTCVSSLTHAHTALNGLPGI